MLDLEPFTLCRFNIERQNSISNVKIQNYRLGSSLVQTSKVILKRFEMHLLSFLSMKELVINSLRPQSSRSDSAPPREIWMTSVGYQAGLHFPTKRN